MSKLPFVARIFWMTLAVVIVLAITAWWVVVRFTGYEMTSADYGGSTISVIILAYLVHLWLLPAEELQGGDPPDDEPRDAEDS